jgi:ParB-like chromosome segregation protein Spo0J
VVVEALRPGLSPRLVVIDVAHVRTLADVFDELPPVLVHESTMTVIDGLHRVEAARLLGRPRLAARMLGSSEEDAFVHAVHANVRHGKPLLAREREAAACRILVSHPQWSDRLISQACGLAARTVAQLRLRATDDEQQLRGRIGRDSRVRAADPAALRLRAAEGIDAEPAASARDVAARVGASQATVLDVRRRLRRGESPLPPRLQPRVVDPSEVVSEPEAPVPARVPAWSDDRALLAAADLADWLTGHEITEDDVGRVAGIVPIGRVFVVVEEARTYARRWTELANQLEKRAREQTRRT